MRRLWLAIRDEKPVSLACLVFMGVVMAISGTTGAADTGPWGWFSVALVVSGIAYAVVFSALWAIVARRRRRNRAVEEGDHRESPAG